MKFTVYNIATTEVLRVNTPYANMMKDAIYDSMEPATRAMNKANKEAGKTLFAVCNSDEWSSVSNNYDSDGNIKMVERVNLMSGKKFMEPINTPNSCSAASETYWSM